MRLVLVLNMLSSLNKDIIIIIIIIIIVCIDKISIKSGLLPQYYRTKTIYTNTRTVHEVKRQVLKSDRDTPDINMAWYMLIHTPLL